MDDWRVRREALLEQSQAYDIECNSGPMQPIYRFGDALIDEQDITFTEGRLHIPGFAQDILLNSPNPYPDMVE